jgi:hypothetical protein
MKIYLTKYDVKLWRGFNWVKIESSGRTLGTRQRSFGVQGYRNQFTDKEVIVSQLVKIFAAY